MNLIQHSIRALLGDHELRFERNGCVAAAPFDGVGSEGKIRNEVAVHDIELNAIDPV